MNLIRNLVGFAIILSLLPVSMLAFRYTADLPFVYSEICDEVSLCQLREMMLIAYDSTFSWNALQFRYKNKECILSQVGDKLLLQPGTQIFLADLDELHFQEKNGVIYVCYRRGKQEYERVLASREGLYLDNFSDCDVRDDQPDRSEE